MGFFADKGYCLTLSIMKELTTQKDSRPLMSIHESQKRSPKGAKRPRPRLRQRCLPNTLHSKRKRGKPQGVNDLEALNSQPNCMFADLNIIRPCRVVLQRMPTSSTVSSTTSTGNVVSLNSCLFCNFVEVDSHKLIYFQLNKETYFYLAMHH